MADVAYIEAMQMPEWIKHPKWKWLRPPVGVVLIILGCLGFLPVLGFWMIPLGLAVLAIDFPIAQRALDWLMEKWRGLEAGWHAWRAKK